MLISSPQISQYYIHIFQSDIFLIISNYHYSDKLKKTGLKKPPHIDILQALLLFYHAWFHNAWFNKTHAACSNYAYSANTHKKDFISNKQCANSVQTQSQYH